MQKATQNPDRSIARPAHFLTLDADVFDGRQSNAWLTRCRIAGSPFIIVRAGKKTATVEWDYISLPESIDGLIATKEEELIAGFRALADKYGNKKTERVGGSKSTQYQNIAIDQAEGLAEAIFDLVTKTLGLSR